MVSEKRSSDLPIRKQLIFSLIVPLLVLGIGELSVRVWAYYFRTSYERYNSQSGRFELVPNIRQTAPSGDEFLINSKGFVGREFETRPSAGLTRIIAVGDSCTFTLGFWRIAYPAVLERLLNAAWPQQRFEVINAGIEGYNSRFALERIRDEIVNYQPKIVTVYIGWNDLMKVNPENVSATGSYPFLARMLEESYLMKAYKKLIFIYLRPLFFQPVTERSEQDASAYDDFTPVAYQNNLREIVQTLDQKGIKCILFTLPTVVRPGMTQSELRKQAVFFPYFAGSFGVDTFLSLHRAYNRVIRRVGTESGVPIVDLDEIFNTRDKNNLFWDTMHPSKKGNQLIAESVHKRIREMNWSFPNTSEKEVTVHEIEHK